MPHITQQVVLDLGRLRTTYVTFFSTLITTRMSPTQTRLKVIIVAHG
jgi:hypothetical protein